MRYNPYHIGQKQVMSHFQRGFAGIMMVVLLVFGNVSREWLHQFSGHTDTVHAHYGELHKGLVIETEHHHCKFLEIPLPVYIESFTWLPVLHVFLVYKTYRQRINHSFFENCQYALTPRAPPVASFLR